MAELVYETYSIVKPIDVICFDYKNGEKRPLAFEWETDDGEIITVTIDDVVSSLPMAEQKAGITGDRYTCVINGHLEFLWYGMLEPRAWYKQIEVSKEEYERNFPLPE